NRPSANVDADLKVTKSLKLLGVPLIFKTARPPTMPSELAPGISRTTSSGRTMRPPNAAAFPRNANRRLSSIEPPRPEARSSAAGHEPIFVGQRPVGTSADAENVVLVGAQCPDRYEQQERCTGCRRVGAAARDRLSLHRSQVVGQRFARV